MNIRLYNSENIPSICQPQACPRWVSPDSGPRLNLDLNPCLHCYLVEGTRREGITTRDSDLIFPQEYSLNGLEGWATDVHASKMQKQKQNQPSARDSRGLELTLQTVVWKKHLPG